MTIHFNEQQLRAMAGDAVFLRGKDYFFDRRVGNWVFKGGILFAQVRGSRQAPYQVKVYLNRKNIHSECTCPYDLDKLCKHAVAALLAFASRDQNAQGSGIVSLQPKGTPLLFSEAGNHIWENPIVRLVLPTRSNFGDFSYGINIQIQIICNDRVIPVDNLAVLADPQNYEFGLDQTMPPPEAFNQEQKHFLKVAYSFLGDLYDRGMNIQPHELAILFKECEGQGIEFYEGKANRLTVRKDKMVGLSLELAVKTKSIKAALRLKDPDDPSNSMQGTVVEGRPCWLVDFEGGRIFPFPPGCDEQLLQDQLPYNTEIDVPLNKIPELFHAVLPRIKDHCPVIYTGEALPTPQFEHISPQFQLHLDYKGRHLTMELKAVYDERVLGLRDMINSPEFMPFDNGRSMVWIRRDLKKERMLARFLMKGGLIQWCNGRLQIANDNIMEFLSAKLPLLEEKCEIYYAPGFKEQFKFQQAMTPRLNFEGQGIDWFH
ncbi:MAG: SNF2 helicase associated domain-containing protein, partial [Candidatus Omnitrophica bacterium]|nr:SNF2 helicase associated domain-containing protein [Candidatus Omnitrophota bacterium]